MQDLIDGLLGFDYNTLLTTAVYTQDSAQMLASATDASRREVFAKLLDLERYERAHLGAKEEARKAGRSYDNAAGLAKEASGKLALKRDQYQQLRLLEANYDNTRTQKIQEFKEKIKGLPPREKVKPLKAELSQLDRELDGIDLGSLQEEVARLGAQAEYIQEKLDERQHFSQETETLKRCPTCKRPFPRVSEVVEGERREGARREIEEIKRQKGIADKRYRDTKSTCDGHLSRFRRRGEVAEGLRRRDRTNEQLADERSYLEERIRELSEETNPHTEALAKVNEELIHLEANADKAEKDSNMLLQAVTLYEDFAELFGKKGIQAYVIENSFGFIEDQTNRYLSGLTVWTTSVDITPQRETKSGDKKEEIDIRIHRTGGPTSCHCAPVCS
jgi:DNA repair exonuclease SbcCD ATPase subunit